MRKKLLLPLFAVCMMTSGCAGLNNMLKAKILEESGISEDKNYQTYQALLEQEMLDEDGIYYEPETEENEKAEIPGDGHIHVTFASNSYIKVNFYYDAEHIHSITEAYLNPGDHIYISEPIASNPITNHYSTDGFRMISYDSEYNVNYEKTVYPDADNKSIIIPEDYAGSELTVQPIGKYDNRIISISDYFVDEDGMKHEMSGSWVIDDMTFRQTSAEISASKDYDVEYHYDPEEYYITSTAPQAYSIDEKKGIVHFEHETALSDVNRFEVEVHKWIDVNLNGNTKKGIDSIFVAELPVEIEEGSLKKVKCGDILTIITKDDYKASSDDMKMIGEPELLTDGYKSTFEVSDTASTQMSIVIGNKLSAFDIPTVNHGKVTVKTTDGTELKDGQSIDGKTDVVVRITADDGYYLSGKDLKNDIYEKKMAFSKYQESIDQILNEHKIIKYITLTLESAGEHGTSAYKISGKTVSGKQTGLKVGQNIKVEYTLTDDKWVFKDESDGVIDRVFDFFQNTINKSKRYIDVAITSEMNGTTINGEDYADITKKGQ